MNRIPGLASPSRRLRALVILSLSVVPALARAAPGHAAGGAPADPTLSSARLARAAAVIDSVRQQLHVPGLAFAIVEDDRVVLARGFGVRDLATRQPVDAQTLFPIGSCTKALTAMAAEISQDQGKLSLDDSPRRYLPWFHMVDPEADALVTLRDMLCHRTGLKAYADLAAAPGRLSREDYLRAAIAARPTARFRETFQYSNAMVSAAGEVVGRAQRTSWEHAIERLIFGPLGMNSSTTSLARLPRTPNHATGYDAPDSSGGRRPIPPPVSLDALAPAGAIASSAMDMTRWMRLLINGGTLDGRRIVSEAGVREVTTPHMHVRGNLSYGLGWVLYEWNHHHVVEHNGGSDGLSALVSMMPERGLGFVILMNASPNPLNAIGNAGRLLWPILLDEAPADAPVATSPAAASTDSALLDTTRLPAVDEVLARMLAAAGGARNLRRRSSLELWGHRSYLNQGVEAGVRIRRQAPYRFESEEHWTAAGRAIGSLRVYCDGAACGQETTFGQDQIYAGDERDDTRRDAAFAWLLDPYAWYSRIDVRGRIQRPDGDVLRIDGTPRAGTPVTWLVSARTFLIVERRRGAATERYSDFRNLDGWVMPFRTAIVDGLGDSELRVESARLDAPVTPGSFEAHRHASRR